MKKTYVVFMALFLFRLRNIDSTNFPPNVNADGNSDDDWIVEEFYYVIDCNYDLSSRLLKYISIHIHYMSSYIYMYTNAIDLSEQSRWPIL